MRVLITGDTGFIGSNVKNLAVSKGHDVIGFSRGNGNDILDTDSVDKAVAGADLVIHAAAFADPAASIKEPEAAIESNLLGTLYVLQACLRENVPCVYLSSCEIYGDNDGAINELSPFKPPNPYAMSKASGDLLCYTFHRSYQADVRSVRLFNPYGPLQQLNKIVPRFYFQAVKNQPLTIYGDGSDTRDYVFIEDVVKGIWESQRAPPGTSLNLASGIKTSTVEFANLVIDLVGSDSKVTNVDYPANFGGIYRQLGDASIAKQLVQWEPKVSLVDGVSRTIDWLRTIDG